MEPQSKSDHELSADDIQKFRNIDDLVQQERRGLNSLLNSYICGVLSSETLYNAEDLFRIVGELNATHNHICSMLASEHLNIYCCLKHLATAYVLANEIEYNCQGIMNIVELITNGKIKACQSCSDDVNQLIKEEK